MQYLFIIWKVFISIVEKPRLNTQIELQQRGHWAARAAADPISTHRQPSQKLICPSIYSASDLSVVCFKVWRIFYDRKHHFLPLCAFVYIFDNFPEAVFIFTLRSVPPDLSWGFLVSLRKTHALIFPKNSKYVTVNFIFLYILNQALYRSRQIKLG